MKGWHWTADTLRDGSPIPPVGEWLEHRGPVRLCKSGLHVSERLLDAMTYAPGNHLHRVELDGVEHSQNDKSVGRRRRILASYDVPMCRLVRVACEAAALASWLVGRCDERLLAAAKAADREDWAAALAAAGHAAEEARDAVEEAGARDAGPAASGAWAAGAAARAAAWYAAAEEAGARDAGPAASVAAGNAARAAARAARPAGAGDAAWAAAWDTLELRAVQLFTTSFDMTDETKTRRCQE